MRLIEVLLIDTGTDPEVKEFDLDGHVDHQGNTYVGKATRMDDGNWIARMLPREAPLAEKARS